MQIISALSVFVITMAVAAGFAVPASADTLSVPLTMEVQPLTIDFEITESIKMSAEAGQNQLTVDDLVITNNDTNGYKINISEIAVVPANGWVMKPASESFEEKIDMKEFSLSTGNHDFYTGSLIGNTEVGNGASQTYSFTGQTGVFTSAVSEKAADIIVTIGYEAPALITFMVDEETYNAIEGMTWREWMASDYNVDSFKLVSGSVLGKFWVGDPESYTEEEAAAINYDVGVKADDVIKNGVHYYTNCCFTAGTQVQTDLDGNTKNIEEFKKGDTIVSYNVDTGEFYLTEVQGLVIHPDTVNMAEVTFADGQKLVMNAYHPVLTDEGFKSLTNFNGFETLEVGDLAKTTAGYSIVTEIVRYIGEPVNTYTLAVKDLTEGPDFDTKDTYIANGIVVHNVSCWYTWF